MSKLKSFSGFIQLIASRFSFLLKMSMIFLIALFLLMAQVLLESAADTNTSKAFTWPIRNLSDVPASAYTFPHKGKFQSNAILLGPPAAPVQPRSKA